MNYFKNKNRKDRVDVINQQPEHVRLNVSPIVVDSYAAESGFKTSLNPQVSSEDIDDDDFYTSFYVSDNEELGLSEEIFEENATETKPSEEQNREEAYFLFDESGYLMSGDLENIENYIISNIDDIDISKLSLFKKIPVKIGLVIG